MARIQPLWLQNFVFIQSMTISKIQSSLIFFLANQYTVHFRDRLLSKWNKVPKQSKKVKLIKPIFNYPLSDATLLLIQNAKDHLHLLMIGLLKEKQNPYISVLFSGQVKNMHDPLLEL